MRLCVIEFWISIFLVKFDSRNRQKVIDFSWKLGEVSFPSRFGTCLDINLILYIYSKYIYIYMFVYVYVYYLLTEVFLFVVNV